MGLNKRKGAPGNFKVSRKQLRKQQRTEKKVKRNEYFSKKKNSKSTEVKPVTEQIIKKGSRKENVKSKEKNLDDSSNIEKRNLKEKREQNKLIKDMAKQRKEQLLKANEKEDQVLRKLEKQLKLNKRKTKSIPKSFMDDGLAYMIEATDLTKMRDMATAEQDLNEVNDEFEEDFALITGTKLGKNKKRASENDDNMSDNFEDMLNEDDSSSDDLASDDESHDDNSSDENVEKTISKKRKLNVVQNVKSKKRKTVGEDYTNDSDSFDSDKDNSESVYLEKGKSKIASNTLKTKKAKSKKSIIVNEENSDTGSEFEEEIKPNTKKTNQKALNNKQQIKNKPKNISKEDGNSDQSFDDSEYSDENKDDIGYLDDSESGEEGSISSKVRKPKENDTEEELESSSAEDDAENNGGTWEDIYGRTRSKDGSVLNSAENKYIPPAIRAKMESGGTEDKKRKEKIDRLKKQLKGLLNRLAESNMHNIASQIENLYMNNSRNDMNETITTLMIDSLISNVATPERLLMEHILLITILHANVGTEVGAHFLQNIVEKFDNLLRSNNNIEDKSLSNVVNILSQLYNFKVFDAKLMYEILQKLAENFDEKNIECILNVLRAVGFNLRKDDPLALRNLILELQKQAASASEGNINNSRIKFLLDVMLAIKNNNMTKIPNYDPSYSEHLKKIMKGFIRKGNYVTQLNISLEDLLNADQRGKWWVVGSAWTGNLGTNVMKKEEGVKSEGFGQKLLDLARKQRMNTDSRRDIFCIMMSAEDYLDAFEKLLKLGLKNQQDRDIIHVLLHCCLQEKTFNPYYAVLAQKFCDYNRKYQMTIKCSVWDKLKTLGNHSGYQISNLAKLLTHLFLEKGLPISTLKIMEFGELDKVTLRFMRQILLGILLHTDVEAVQSVFEKVAVSEKLKMFRESLRLFIHHFLLKNLKTDAVPEEHKEKLKERAKLVERILTAKDSRLRL